MRRRRLPLVGLALALGAGAAGTLAAAPSSASTTPQAVLGARGVPLLHVSGLVFKDLDRNGRLDTYEDWRKPAKTRALDLVGRMTLAEKAATMVHGTLPTASASVPGGGSSYDLAGARAIIQGEHVTSAITRLSGAADSLAAQDNALQQIAEQGRLGIPLTISTDPRNSFQYVPGASVQSGSFSQWPETTGLAATRDAQLVRRFGDIARQEYRAVGITMALSPQADVATEPRWARINGTFGEDATVVKKMARAYVRGFQAGGDGLNQDSVLTVVKHWGGYGAQENGFDSHNAYGKYATFTSTSSFLRHLDAFKGAFQAGAAGVMPTYSIIKGVSIDGAPLEQVGAGYSKQMLTDLLRGTYGFDGVVLSDWGITGTCDANCTNGWPAGQTPGFVGFGTDWGVEGLSVVDRYAKGINAGIDQFGGTEDSAPIVQAVSEHKLTVARVNTSVMRVLTQKFQQGLFENAYVDPAAAARIVGNAGFQAEATAAQERSTVLLKNARVPGSKKVLPLRSGTKVYLYGVDAAAARRAGLTVVTRPEDADVALARTSTPFQTLHPNYTFGSRQHEGNLAFAPGQPDFDAISAISAKVPTIVSVYMDRPAILTALEPKTSAILANFGISDDALLSVVTGAAEPDGKLPFELPSSMAAVATQKSDLPADSAHPLYRLGFGLHY
ncbi:beta-glucosidase [Motilibacter peucedani]|uniref:beta-glucosidase n=1 Tax=Motilibacter peucedani TaxID=598650 RepID=A0A420XNC6_9ACTN|nr:glycoside hydrolase family 3 N-terminal domain-containing protein [Motilibacter peucedani]RKS72790.1 beta-glucosidase [Motilibacter peucedani]